MCYSFEVSIGTFLFSWGSAFYLLSKDLTIVEQQNIYFLMIFSTIQLLDAILWSVGMKKNSINYAVTSYLIPAVLCAQVIYNLLVINQLWNPLVLGVILATVVSLFNLHRGYSKQSCNMFDSPIWGDAHTKLGMLYFALMISYGRIGLSGTKLHFLLVIFLSLFASWLFSGGEGSLWCAFANIASIYYLVMYRNK
tara:strand:+ start:14545 stop:15129 length:585 start_codon:yes stop_codon:yes gene_type:complete